MDSRQKTIRKIKKILRAHPGGLTISDLAEKIHLNRNSTAKYLEVLLMSGDVKCTTFGPAKVYTFSQRMPLSAMLKFTADVILLVDTELHVLDANEHALSLLGIRREDLVGRVIDDLKSPFIASIDIPGVMAATRGSGEIMKVFQIMQQHEYRHYRVRFIPTVFDTLDEGLTIIGEDITSRIRFEESLSMSEARYRAIVEEQTDMICRWRPNGSVTFINPVMTRVTGISCDPEKMENIFSFVCAEDIPRIKKALSNIDPDHSTVSFQLRIQDCKGEYRWYNSNTRGIFDNSGLLIEYQSVGRDISTERQQAKKIQESEERFRMVTDILPFPVSIADSTGQYLYVNSAFTHLFGFALGDLPSVKVWLDTWIQDPDTRENAGSDDTHSTNWDLGGGGGPRTAEVTCKDGSRRLVNYLCATLKSHEHFVVYEDLTLKKESEHLHSILASIINTSDDATALYRNLRPPLPPQNRH